MKNLKLLFTLIMTFGMMSIYAQQNSNDKMNATIIKEYEFEKNGEKIPYKIHVQESRAYHVKLDKADKGKLNQDRVTTPASVTKLIFVNNDTDKSYDRYIVLRYEKDADDSFELVPTKRGFGVKVDKRYMEYIMGEGIHFVNNADKDFFFVDEFNAL